MRVLLIGGSQLMAWVVAHLAPPHAEVEHCETFADAEATLSLRPPRAVVFAVTPDREPWTELADLCALHQPPIPFFAYFLPRDSAAEPGAAGSGASGSVRRPLSAQQLRSKLEELVEAASLNAAAPRSPAEPD